MTSDLFSLKGKTALITGGGSGIGQAIARSLSDAGAYIIVVGRRAAPLQETLKEREGLAIAADLLSESVFEELHSTCANYGTFPDIIVNAAGVNPRKHADEINIDEWNSTVYLNLTAPFFVSQTFVTHMKKKKWGRIINIASLQSERAFANGISYGAAKGGVTQLTRAMAEAWSKDGIICNAIQPGFFPTELTAPVFEDEKMANHHASMTCIGRNGELSDLAGPAVFLASDACAYVTGQMIPVDGGYTAK